MTATIPINLAVEDALTEHVLRIVLKTTALPYSVDAVYCKGGGHLSKAEDFGL